MSEIQQKSKAPSGTVTIQLPPLAIPRELLEGLAAPADMVSQHNVLAVVGMPRRVFLDLMRQPDAPPVTKIGKLRMVERVVLLDWLKLRAVQGSPRARLALVSPTTSGADAVLAELGLERVGGVR